MYQETAPPEPAAPPKAGEPEAPPPEKPATLAALFEAEESRILRYSMTLVAGDFAAAQDLVQEAFLRLHRHGYERVNTPRAWLTTTLRRLAADRRKKRTECALEPHHDAEDPALTGAPERLERAESTARLRLHLADLPARDRELLRLKFHEDLDYATIATRTGLSLGNVGYRLHHLLKKLAARMRDEAE